MNKSKRDSHIQQIHKLSIKYISYISVFIDYDHFRSEAGQNMHALMHANDLLYDGMSNCPPRAIGLPRTAYAKIFKDLDNHLVKCEKYNLLAINYTLELLEDFKFDNAFLDNQIFNASLYSGNNNPDIRHGKKKSRIKYCHIKHELEKCMKNYLFEYAK